MIILTICPQNGIIKIIYNKTFPTVKRITKQEPYFRLLQTVTIEKHILSQMF